MDVYGVSLTQHLKCDLSRGLVALVALNRSYEATSEGKIMKLAERKGWRRLCGWKKASKSRGEIFHKPGQRLQAETRTRESPERWGRREQDVGRSESKLGLVFVGGENHQEQRVPDGVSMLQTAPDCFFYLIILLHASKHLAGEEKQSQQISQMAREHASTGSGSFLAV